MSHGWAMGRSKGIVEIHFNDSETKELAKSIIDAMPAEHKGAVNVDGSKLFGGFATGISALFQYHGSLVSHTTQRSHCDVQSIWLNTLQHLGTAPSKDSSIAQFAWVLQPLAEAVPTQPIHQTVCIKLSKSSISILQTVWCGWLCMIFERYCSFLIVETCWDIWPLWLAWLHVYVSWALLLPTA